MTTKQFVTGIIGFALLMTVFLLLFSQWKILSFLNFADKNEAANFVNSLTAPVIGIAGAVLVFVSFREQVKANRMQFTTITEQRDLELLYKFYEELKQDLQRMQAESGSKYEQPAILDSLMNYIIADKPESPYPEFEQYLHYVFRQFVFLSNRIKRNTSLSPSETVYVIDKIQYLYDLYFKSYHTKLTRILLEKEFGKSMKNALQQVHVQMEKLASIHANHKEALRGENSD